MLVAGFSLCVFSYSAPSSLLVFLCALLCSLILSFFNARRSSDLLLRTLCSLCMDSRCGWLDLASLLYPRYSQGFLALESCPRPGSGCREQARSDGGSIGFTKYKQKVKVRRSGNGEYSVWNERPCWCLLFFGECRFRLQGIRSTMDTYQYTLLAATT